ncbi:MAG: CBS domain-containing protein [Reyranella sp.]|nr:CBS domain-containing protein [Reyranella sp.]MBL6651734.1 CBS domain-containing protein [Reyranella sp.]
MQAGEVMTTNLVTVRPDATVRNAAAMMDDLNVGALPVCDGRRLVGIITDRDITVRATADGMQPDTTQVQAVMTDQVCWCFEDDDVGKIERAMAKRQIRRMPVVDESKRLVGMIALGDLVTNRAPGAEDTLRSISNPLEPDRSGASSRPRGDGYGSWPAYGGDSDCEWYE